MVVIIGGIRAALRDRPSPSTSVRELRSKVWCTSRLQPPSPKDCASQIPRSSRHSCQKVNSLRAGLALTGAPEYEKLPKAAKSARISGRCEGDKYTAGYV